MHNRVQTRSALASRDGLWGRPAGCQNGQTESFEHRGVASATQSNSGKSGAVTRTSQFRHRNSRHLASPQLICPHTENTLRLQPRTARWGSVTRHGFRTRHRHSRLDLPTPGEARTALCNSADKVLPACGTRRVLPGGRSGARLVRACGAAGRGDGPAPQRRCVHMSCDCPLQCAGSR